MKREKRNRSNLEEENLDRFAGSSDEEEEEKPMAPPAPTTAAHLDADGEYDHNDNASDDDSIDDIGTQFDNEERTKHVGDDNDDLSSVEEEEQDAATKMASVMSRILGATTKPKSKSKKDTSSSPVVLANTITPLQKQQRKEKEQDKAMKEKRKANRERNLTALHLPLSIATTNSLETDGQLSVAKELEQERFHRRVATRGVVALFNAITQHQKSSNSENDGLTSSSKKKETTKLTKHGFLDKIKAAAKTKENNEQKESGASNLGKNASDNDRPNRSTWGALKDDYMLGSKKNWDEESSEEESDTEAEGDATGSKPQKKRRISRKQ